jgi:hypothetical protein
MTRLVKYDAACRAISEAKAVDEVKDIRDKAVAMVAYARQAKNRDLEADALEIRLRATRRIDQLRQAQKETVGLAEGGWRSRGLEKNPQDAKPTLASQGIDKNLAHQARTLGALSEDRFEQVIADSRDAVTRAVKTVMRGADIELEKRILDQIRTCYRTKNGARNELRPGKCPYSKNRHGADSEQGWLTECLT